MIMTCTGNEARRGVRSAPNGRSRSSRARKKGVFFINHSADNTNVLPRLTALDEYGDPYLPGLPGLAEPCEDCPGDRVCRECRYSAVVKALYCFEEADAARAEGRAPVPPRTLPRPRPVFFPREERRDPVSALCEALFQPFTDKTDTGRPRGCGVRSRAGLTSTGSDPEEEPK